MTTQMCELRVRFDRRRDKLPPLVAMGRLVSDCDNGILEFFTWYEPKMCHQQVTLAKLFTSLNS